MGESNWKDRVTKEACKWREVISRLLLELGMERDAQYLNKHTALEQAFSWARGSSASEVETKDTTTTRYPEFFLKRNPPSSVMRNIM